MTPDEMPIDILHTRVVWCWLQKIARTENHPKVTAESLITLCQAVPLLLGFGDMLDENAILGPVDQIGQYPANSIIRVLKDKPISEIDDETIILADIAAKATRQVYETAVEILTPRVEWKRPTWPAF